MWSVMQLVALLLFLFEEGLFIPVQNPTDYVHSSPAFFFSRNASSAVYKQANAAGEQIRALFNDGRDRKDDWPPHSYVNYADGVESLEAMYGYDAWRLAKLKQLKRDYDPENKFKWYAPISGGTDAKGMYTVNDKDTTA